MRRQSRGLTGPLQVHYTYGFPTASRGFYLTETVTPAFPLAGYWSAEPRDNVYSDGHWGEAMLWYTDPDSGKEVVKTAPIRIVDDEPRPAGAIDGGGHVREATYDRELTFPLRLSGAATIPIVIDLTPVDGTATYGADYSLPQTSFTFAPGETELPVTLRILGDAVAEGAEGFQIRTSSGAVESFAILEASPPLLPDSVSVLAGDPADMVLQLATELEVDAIASVTASSNAVIVLSDTVLIRAGDTSVPLHIASASAGTATITVTFDDAAGVPPVTGQAFVYDGTITFADAAPLRLKVGETKEVLVDMKPAPPEALLLTLEPSAAGIVKTAGSHRRRTRQRRRDRPPARRTVSWLTSRSRW